MAAVSGSPGSEVDDVLAARSRMAAVAEAIPSLGALERAALYHAISGQRPGESAAMLGVGYKSAENAPTRARRKQRENAKGMLGAVTSIGRRRRADDHPGPGAGVAS